MAQFDDTAKRRIRFQTRRGLLELDIVLNVLWRLNLTN